MANLRRSRPAVRQRGRPRRRPQPQLPNDLNAPKQVLRYHTILVCFMSYTHGREYAKDAMFSK